MIPLPQHSGEIYWSIDTVNTMRWLFFTLIGKKQSISSWQLLWFLFFFCFSLFRLPDVSEAQIRFISLREVLPPLVEHMPHYVVNKQGLQTVCDLTRDHPTWSPAHIAAYLGYAKVFRNSSIVKWVNFYLLFFSFV